MQYQSWLIRALFLLFMTSTYIICTAQAENSGEKVLIIDTLIGDAQSFWGVTDRRDTEKGGTGAVFILPFPKIEDPSQHPVLQVVLPISSPNAVLRLKLDDSDGYVIIKGLFALKEEVIRIRSWRVFPIPSQDTIFKREIVYHVVPADTADPYHPIKDTTTIQKISRGRLPHNPANLIVFINGVRYEQPLRLEIERKQIVSWHGPPDMSEEAWLELKRSGLPYDLHTGSLFRNQMRLAATIEMVD